MVDRLPVSQGSGARTNVTVGDDRGYGGLLPVPPITGVRPIAAGRPGNRWPNPRELAALVVNGILRLPQRYRRGMFLDILV